MLEEKKNIGCSLLRSHGVEPKLLSEFVASVPFNTSIITAFLGCVYACIHIYTH